MSNGVEDNIPLMGLIRILIIFCVCMGGFMTARSQPPVQGKPKPLTLTSKEDFRKAKRNARPPKRKNVSYIYKTDTKGVYFGNPCVMKATRRMGFEYVLQPPGVPGSPDEETAQLNNILVNLKLLFTRGPFWKMILKKRIKDCRTLSGDFVG